MHDSLRVLHDLYPVNDQVATPTFCFIIKPLDKSVVARYCPRVVCFLFRYPGRVTSVIPPNILVNNKKEPYLTSVNNS